MSVTQTSIKAGSLPKSGWAVALLAGTILGGVATCDRVLHCVVDVVLSDAAARVRTPVASCGGGDTTALRYRVSLLRYGGALRDDWSHS